MQAVENNSEPKVGMREGWENLAFIQSAYESMETGKPIDVAVFQD